MTEYIQVNVLANAGQYSDSCKSVCKYRYGEALEKLPPNSKVVEIVTIETNGLATWCYVFYAPK